MKSEAVRVLICALVISIVSVAPSFAVPPVAPSALAPAPGTGVLVPFAISWSAVSDPGGIAAYNWQVSSSPSFASVILQSSTNGATQDSVSGLPNGTYFWRVQAVNGAFEQGAWSAPRGFSVTGTGPDSPGTPTLGPPQAYSTFHPYENMTFNWSAVPGAPAYVLEASKDPSFPIATRIHFDNIPGTTMTFTVTDRGEGNYWARVYAVNANRTAGVPSSSINFSVFYTNPIGPSPAQVSPAKGATVTLPVILTWAHVPNPQPSGYELQIAKDSGFTTIEEDDPQLNGPSREVLSLSAGTKFWRIRSGQGNASVTTAAFTAWSSTGTFTIPTAPPTPVSVVLARNPLFGGQTTLVQVQLTSAVGAGGASIALSSSDPSALPMPATITMPANTAWTQFDMTQFGMKAGQVTRATPLTITASLNGASASGQFTVLPTALRSVSINPGTIAGGSQPGGIVMLNGQAPAAGALVMLSSDNAALNPPPNVSVSPGLESVSFPINTSPVSVNTTATLTATWNGGTASAQVTLTPAPPPPAASLATIAVTPSSVTGGGTSQGTVTLSSAAPQGGAVVTLSSNSPAAGAPASVTIPAGAISATFAVSTTSVATATPVTLSAVYNGLTRTTTLTVNPTVQTAALTLTATGRAGERVTSTPVGLSVPVGTTGSASVTAGKSITLAVTSGRSAIWSGACSSNGGKTSSCTFTLNAAVSVTANVQ